MDTATGLVWLVLTCVFIAGLFTGAAAMAILHAVSKPTRPVPVVRTLTVDSVPDIRDAVAFDDWLDDA